jgi:hypothetical protein
METCLWDIQVSKKITEFKPKLHEEGNSATTTQKEQKFGLKFLLGLGNDVYFIFSIYSTRRKHCTSWYKILGFHSGDYKECRLLRYENPVCTSQEKYYISATEPSRLMLCKVWRFHVGEYEKFRLLGCEAAWLLFSQERIASIIRVKRKSELGKTLVVNSNWSSSYLADSFHFVYGGDTFFRSVGSYKSHTATHPKRSIFDPESDFHCKLPWLCVKAERVRGGSSMN